jgi:hypothetical protein
VVEGVVLVVSDPAPEIESEYSRARNYGNRQDRVDLNNPGRLQVLNESIEEEHKGAAGIEGSLIPDVSTSV